MDIAIKAGVLKVRELADLKREGRLHLPDLQRGFVWDSERVRMLFDSLERRYPVGSLLLWKPAWTDDDSPLTTRPWDLYPPSLTTEAGTAEALTPPRPGSVFVLDGQQRLTSLFRVIFDSRRPARSVRDPDLYVSLSGADNWRESPFLFKSRHIRKEDERAGLLIPAADLFAGIRTGDRNGAESTAVARAINNWLSASDPGFFAALDRANQIRQSILNAEIVSYEIDTSAEDENVIEIFGRLNQQAIRLTPGDLAAARLTGKMRNFRQRANSALQDPALQGFSIPEGSERSEQGGFVDTDLLVRTAMCLATGVVKYRDAEKLKRDRENLYDRIEPQWDTAIRALRDVVGLLRDAGVRDGTWIPYRYILLPPAVAFGRGHTISREEWLGWAISASLWGLYAGSSETKVQTDARNASEGKRDALWASLRTHARRRDTLIPEAEDLSAGLVQRTGALLALLVALHRDDARSFYGARFQGTPDALERHHIFPRVLFAGQGRVPRDSTRLPDRIGNLTILTGSDNASLADTPPEQYLAGLWERDPALFTQHCIPQDAALWVLERFGDFCTERERLLAERFHALLTGLSVT